MDAALYQKLLEDVQSDLAKTAPGLQELQSVESFLSRRAESARDKASYQNVLEDISAEIERQNQWVSELERIDRYVSSQLGKPGFKWEPVSVAAPVAAKPVPAKPPVEAAAKPAAAKPVPPVKKPDVKPEKDEDTKDEPPQRGKGLQEMSAASSGMTIEFGPDGFPISSLGAGKGKTDKGSTKATIPDTAGMDGATINFGPDGFPLDFPKPGSKKK